MNQYRAIEDVIERLDQSLWDPLDVVAYRTKAPKFMILTQMQMCIRDRCRPGITAGDV